MDDDYEFDLYDYDPYEGEPACERCDGTGWVCDCIDDLCQSIEPGEFCMHGDGGVCPKCHGRNLL